MPEPDRDTPKTPEPTGFITTTKPPPVPRWLKITAGVLALLAAGMVGALIVAVAQ